MNTLKLTAALMICLATVFCSVAQEMVRYAPVVDLNNVFKWETDTSRSFDANGIILNNDDYHPVGIIQYGMLTLDQYHRTGDSKYLTKSKAQAEYILGNDHILMDPDGKGAALPYNFDFKGLLAPWFSGMAQGLAVSYLIRYQKVVDDPRIPARVEQLMRKMLRPIALGGCLNRTPEDHLWIEEYPGTPESPQVLNGFIFALVGLIEYCEHFEADSERIRLKEDLLNGLKSVIHVYDMLRWTKYNRAVMYPIKLNYLRLQIWQMRQLHSLTDDDFWLRQLCIWSAMALGKEQEEDFQWWAFDKLPVGVAGPTIQNVIQPDRPVIKYDEFEQQRIDDGLVDPFPWYGFTASRIVDVPEAGGKFRVLVDSSAEEVHIIYRYHWNDEIFEFEKWRAVRGVSGHELTLDLKKGKCQVGIFYRMREPGSTLKVNHIGWLK